MAALDFTWNFFRILTSGFEQCGPFPLGVPVQKAKMSMLQITITQRTKSCVTDGNKVHKMLANSDSSKEKLQHFATLSSSVFCCRVHHHTTKGKAIKHYWDIFAVNSTKSLKVSAEHIPHCCSYSWLVWAACYPFKILSAIFQHLLQNDILLHSHLTHTREFGNFPKG